MFYSDREKDKKDFEDKIIANVREMVNPYVEKLKATTLDGEVQKIYLDLIKSHLKISSPFAQNIKFNHMNNCR